jgi:hypothetical protein
MMKNPFMYYIPSLQFAPRAERKMTFNDAVLYCQFLEYDGHRDWHLPTRDEYFEPVNGKLPATWFADDERAYSKDNGEWYVLPVRNV